MSINPPNRAGKWRRVSANHPCRICGKPDWCSESVDGRLAACRRVEVGSWKSKLDRNGAACYLHRLDGTASSAAPSPPVSGPGPALATPDTLQDVYSALLSRLPLSKEHRANLGRRGLPDAEIDRRGYRSLGIQGRARIAAKLREQFGDLILTVPGFVTKEGNNGRYLTLAGAAGLLIPVRDLVGRIVALLSRRDDAGDGRGKYQYLSSIRYGGPGPGASMYPSASPPRRKWCA